MGGILLFVIVKSQAVRALVGAVKGRHVLIYAVELQPQQLGRRGFQPGTHGRIWLGGVFPIDRASAFRGAIFDSCLRIRLGLNTFDGFLGRFFCRTSEGKYKTNENQRKCSILRHKIPNFPLEK